MVDHEEPVLASPRHRDVGPLPRDLRTRPVYVLGAASAVSHTTMSEWSDFTESPAARSGKLAFERAGLTPADIDVCQFYEFWRAAELIDLGRATATRALDTAGY